MLAEQSSRPSRSVQAVDPHIADLVPRYVAQCRTHLVRLGHHFHADEFEAITAIGWDLHGTGRTFGFERISVLGDRLARAAEQADGSTVLRTIHALQRYLDALTLVFPHRATSADRSSRTPRSGPSVILGR